MRNKANKTLLTIGDVARICQVAPRTASGWVDRGLLQGFRIPGGLDRRVRTQDLREFMSRHGLPLDRFPGGGRTSVLLVGFPGAVGEVVARQLREQGDVALAENAFEAGVMTARRNPDVILASAVLREIPGALAIYGLLTADRVRQVLDERGLAGGPRPRGRYDRLIARTAGELAVDYGKDRP